MSGWQSNLSKPGLGKHSRQLMLALNKHIAKLSGAKKIDGNEDKHLLLESEDLNYLEGLHVRLLANNMAVRRVSGQSLDNHLIAMRDIAPIVAQVKVLVRMMAGEG
jgi:hypothetical protein